MLRSRIAAAVALVALSFVLASAAPRTGSPHCATVAPFRQPPAIDGKLAPGEWDGAVRTVGFQNIQNGRTDARMGSTYFGFAGDTLYFAVVSELPPDGKLRAAQKNRDSDVIWDDGIEIWLDPNRDRRESGEGDPRYYTFMGNSIGTILDVCNDPKKGSPDPGWNAHWTYANRVDPEAGTWTAELSVPVADLGWQPGEVFGRSIGVLIARNYKPGGWLQGTWFPHRGAFAGWFEYPRMLLTRDAPSVAVEGLGAEVFAGRLALQARIRNPGPARQAQARLLVTSSDMPELKDERTVDLPAGGDVPYTFTVPAGRLHETAEHKLSLVVQSPDGAATYLNYAMQWTQAPQNKWPGVRTGPDPDAAVRIAYYPSYRFLRVRVDTNELEKDAAAVRSARVTIAGPGGKRVLDRDMAWEQAPAMQEFRLPELPDGEYAVSVALKGYDRPFERKFTRKHFPWEGNKLGISDRVFMPFTPISVQGQDVSVVLRRYRSDGLGLWSGVESERHELLAGPIRLVADGTTPLEGKGKFVEKKPARVVYQGQAVTPAVTARTRCTTEYDGCVKVELELRPGAKKQELQSLALEIPLRDGEAPLWHVCTSGLRNNPAGFTPAGEGDVWDSTKFPDGNWYGNFKPYLWLGSEERGLCWFADNDRGWVLDVEKERQAPCLVLHREKGVLTLRVNLVQKPVTLKEPRTIVFGLMASPAKPMPQDWRRVTFAQGYQEYPNIAWMGSEYWGADTSFSSKYPRNGDLSILDRMMDLRLGKAVDTKAFAAEWEARNLRPEMPLAEKNEKQIMDLVRVSLNMAAGARGTRNRSNVYWEEFHSTNPVHEEVRTFGNEWSGQYGFGSTGGLVPSYRDFAVWWGAQFIRRGLGLYFDNAFPKRAYDPVTTSAYRLPNGDIQPSAGIWAHREYLKRIWVIHRTEVDPRLPVIQMIHMTNTHIVPYMVWNDSNLDLEWFYGPEPQQSKYPYDLLRAESLGRQTGNIPLALARVENTRSPEEKRIAERTRFGVLMVHEIKATMGSEDGKLMRRVLDFGYGQDDCEVLDYWDEGYPMRPSSDAVKSLLLKRGGEWLLVLCTWNPNPETVTLALTNIPATTATDEETGEALALAPGKLTVPLDGYGVRIVRLK